MDKYRTYCLDNYIVKKIDSLSNANLVIADDPDDLPMDANIGTMGFINSKGMYYFDGNAWVIIMPNKKFVGEIPCSISPMIENMLNERPYYKKVINVTDQVKDEQANYIQFKEDLSKPKNYESESLPNIEDILNRVL